MKPVNDWTFDNKIIAISPSLLNMNVYMLWISLFAEQRKNFIRIPNSHLSNEAALTLANLFEDYTGISITTNNLQFALYGIKEIVVLALKLKRPHYEIYRFLEFLSDNEYTKLIHLLSNERFGLRRVNFEYR
ncbi:hypothetical protein [Lysinibacillus halotolerans]|uniref:Uncharacterized protein n=1 Tax=Lysinibacillus halotolerans TaxID=1368476 RepID=A0A3M8HB05_9BACI|nr:hypothetical protein [Lysinibacillus halotolerans]RNC99581.1 hypothetical protein EC501_07485 [Lysinibacillus halotolerans]